MLILQLKDRAAKMILAVLVPSCGILRARTSSVFLLVSRMNEELKPVLRNKLHVELKGIVVQHSVIIRTVHNGRLDLLNTVGTPPPDLIFEDRASSVETEILDVSDAVVPQAITKNLLQFIPLSRIYRPSASRRIINIRN